MVRVAEKTLSLLPISDVPAVKVGDDFKYSMPIVGEAVIISEAKGQGSTRQPKNDLMLGRVEPVQKLSDEKVVAWVK